MCHLWTWLCSSCSCEVHALAASALFQEATRPLRIAVAMRTWQHGGMGCKRGNGHLNVVCPMNRDLPGARYHQPARHQRAAVPLLGGTDTMQFLGSVRMLGYAMKVATHTGTLQPFLNTTRFTSVYAARQRLVSSASVDLEGHRPAALAPGTSATGTGDPAPARWRTLLDFDVWQSWSVHGLAARAHPIEQVPQASPRVRVDAPAKCPAAVALARQRLLDARQAQAALDVQEAELDADFADMQRRGPVRLRVDHALSAPSLEHKLLCTDRHAAGAPASCRCDQEVGGSCASGPSIRRMMRSMFVSHK